MYTIVIKKSPTSRLFDRMPLPKAKVRAITVPRSRLSLNNSPSPFQRKISRIK